MFMGFLRLDRCYVEWAEPRWRRGQRLRRALEVLSVDWERSARDEMSPRTLSVRARVSKDERPGRRPQRPQEARGRVGKVACGARQQSPSTRFCPPRRSLKLRWAKARKLPCADITRGSSTATFGKIPEFQVTAARHHRAACAPKLRGEQPPMSTATDAELIAIGERFEKLLLEHMDAWLVWAPRMRAAHQKSETTRSRSPPQ